MLAFGQVQTSGSWGVSLRLHLNRGIARSLGRRQSFQRLLAGLPCSDRSHAMPESASAVHVRVEMPGDGDNSPLPAGKTRASMSSFHDMRFSGGPNDIIHSGDGAKENCQEFAVKRGAPVKLPAVKPWDPFTAAAQDDTRSPVRDTAGDTICPHSCLGWCISHILWLLLHASSQKFCNADRVCDGWLQCTAPIRCQISTRKITCGKCTTPCSPVAATERHLTNVLTHAPILYKRRYTSGGLRCWKISAMAMLDPPTWKAQAASTPALLCLIRMPTRRWPTAAQATALQSCKTSIWTTSPPQSGSSETGHRASSAPPGCGSGAMPAAAAAWTVQLRSPSSCPRRQTASDP